MDQGEKIVLTFGLIFLWTIGLLIIGGMGFSRHYFWITTSCGAAGFGIYPFWRHRAQDWFYISVAIISLIHLFLLIYFEPLLAIEELPKKHIVMSILIADTMISWGIALLVCRFLTRSWPWQLSDLT